MRTRSTRHAGATATILTTALALGVGCVTTGPKPAAKAPPSTRPAERIGTPPDPRSAEWEARRQEIAALVERATRSATAADRAAAALAAADAGTGPLAKTIAAVDAARDVALTNLANFETVSYKAATARVDGDRVTIARDFQQGSLQNTGRPLDLGIQGEGFLKVAAAGNGQVGYTRNGNLFANRNSELVVGVVGEHKLDPASTLPAGTTEVSISQDGRVYAQLPNQTDKVNVGQIKLARFINADGLSPAENTIYHETDLSGPPQFNVPGDGGSGQLLQGFLESSNVDLAREKLRLQFLVDWREVLMRIADGQAAATRPAAAPPVIRGSCPPSRKRFPSARRSGKMGGHFAFPRDLI